MTLMHMKQGPNPMRRQALWTGLGVALVAALQGCAVPAPAAPPAPGLPAGLREGGFPRTEEGWELDLGARLLFAFGADQPDPATSAVVTRLGQALAGAGVRQCRVEGHADEVGSDAYNLSLSQRRAETVARLLVAQGLPTDGMKTRGLGKRKPVADNRSESGRAQNRRVVVIVPALD